MFSSGLVNTPNSRLNLICIDSYFKLERMLWFTYYKN